MIDSSPSRVRAPDTFADFYTSTAARTFSAARRTAAGNKEVAADATHDAYVVMLEQWENRQSHPCEANQRYVIAIAVHKVADWYRKGNVQRLCDDGLDEQAGATDDYRNILDGLTIFAAVREVLVRQPAARRAVGVLVFLEGFTYVEAAEALGISQSTVRTHIQRLREQLRPLATQIGEIDQGGEPS